MSTITRRSFLGTATAMGARVAWGRPFGTRSHIAGRERRDLFPEGVASGDPDGSSVLLWTRRPMAGENLALKLTVEVSEDEMSTRVVAPAAAPGFRSIRLDLPCVGRRAKAQASVLVPIHRFRRPWQPYRQDNYSAGAGRRQTGSFCFCELPECEPGGAERLPQNDFRGRTSSRSEADWLRAAPRRLHL
jgi:hypothetical protein